MFRISILFLFVITIASGCNHSSNSVAPIVINNSIPNSDSRDFNQYTEIIWKDEFDGTNLDITNWTPEIKDVWYNNELEATTSSNKNLNVNGGFLNITAIKESYNGRQYTSGRIISKGKHDFIFGRLDVKAKLPKGKGMWPAIWMLGANDSQVGWPACGETDIMELRGSIPNVVLSTLHNTETVANNQNPGSQYTLPQGTIGDFNSDFHLFTCIRSLNKMEFYVDGNKFYTSTSSNFSSYPFNNSFYVILNLAVGGDFDGNPDANTIFPQAMQVDYVKFLQYKQ